MTGRDDDEERTQFIPMPGAPARGEGSAPPAAPQPDEDGDERTQFVPMPAPGRPAPAAEEEEERTQFLAMPQPTPPPPAAAPSASPPPEEDERTQFAPMGQPPAAPVQPSALPPGLPDEDRTQFAPVAPAPTPQPTAAPQPEDDDRTQFAAGAAIAAGAAAARDPSLHPSTQAMPLGGGTTDRPQSWSEPPQGRPAHADGTEQPTSTGAFLPPQDPTTYVAPPPDMSQPPATGVPGATRPGGPAQIGVGTVINNNYRVEQVLKSGGMGSVYRGVNIHTEDPVAIKVILPELAEDEKVGLMFKREARTLGQLQDDAIVRYYNYVFDPELGGYCLVMEFISGIPLSDQTHAHGPISTEDGVILLRRLAKGLQKAHDQEVVHRDLSPDNVMLPHAKVEEAVLIDFGIAKSNVVKESTMAGQFAGKFKYVAPEQLGHFGGEIGPRADIYSLALLLAAGVIGKPIDMGGSIVEAVQRREAIPDLSDVPEDLRPIIAHMLEPDPGLRPASMSEVVELLDEPERIPMRYRQGLPLPNTSSRSGTTTRTYTPMQAVQGFQAPPSAGVRGGTTTTGDLPAQPATRGGGGLVVPLVALLALGAASAGVWYTIGDRLAGGDGGETPAAASPDGGRPEIAENTREGFLATFDTGACTYATRIPAGPDAGMVAGFAQAPDTSFSGLPTAYEERFGARPDIAGKAITPEQCPALELARGLQGTTLEPIEMTLDAREVASGETFSGRISDAGGRPVWLALVSPRGGVFNLTPRLSAPVGGVRTFSIGLNLAAGAEAAPQLLVAVASDGPLVRTAAAQDGAVAADLMPLIAREIEGKDGRAVAALGHVLLVPEPAPEAAPGDTPSGEDEAPSEEPSE